MGVDADEDRPGRRPGVGQVLGPAVGPEAEELVGDRGLLLGLEIRQRLQRAISVRGQLESEPAPLDR